MVTYVFCLKVCVSIPISKLRECWQGRYLGVLRGVRSLLCRRVFGIIYELGYFLVNGPLCSRGVNCRMSCHDALHTISAILATHLFYLSTGYWLLS